MKAAIVRFLSAHRSLVALFCIALGVRLAFAVWAHPPSGFIYSDMERYVQTAGDLLSGHQSPWQTFHPVAFSVPLALILRVTGSLQSLGWWMAVLSASLVPATYFAGIASGLERRFALGAAAIVTFSLPLIHYTGFALTEIPASALLVWAFVLATSTNRSAGTMVALGLLAGCAIAIRPNLALAGCVLLAPVWGELKAKPWLLLAWALPVLAASAYNSSAAGRPTGPSANAGLNLYLNFAPVKRLVYNVNGDLHWVSPNPNNVRYSFIEQTDIPFYDDRDYLGKASRLLIQEPALMLTALRNLPEAAGIGMQRYWPELQGWEGPEALWDRLQTSFLILPGILGFAFWFRNLNGPARMAGSIAALGALSAYLFLGDPRLRVPFDPFWTVLGLLAWQAVLAKDRSARPDPSLAGPAT